MKARRQPRQTGKHAGFTLIEILVVLAIVAVLAGLASSGLNGFMARRAVDAAVNDLAADYRFARSEAVKRSGYVTICRSPDGMQCPAWGTFGSWHDGWIVFADNDRDRIVDPGEEILRVQARLSGVQRIGQTTSPGFDNTVQFMVFGPNGLSNGGGNQTLIVTAGASVIGGTRLFVVSRNGRAAVRPVGTPLPP